jgi:adenosylmethionine-8-amino-7-oxononanoate aminotransferase
MTRPVAVREPRRHHDAVDRRRAYSITASTPLPVAARAEGCRIWDADGREYIDACGGAMVMSLGHRHPRLLDALHRQSEEITFTYRHTFASEPAQDLAELLANIAPMERAWSFFNSSGSESVESALHLALLYWRYRGEPERTAFIARRPSYHGSTVGALGLSGSRVRAPFEAILADDAVAWTPNADIRARRSPAEETAFAIADLEAAIQARGAAQVAGVFIEPITGASAAAVVPPDDYLAAVRALCDHHGILLICDETITGFGRTGTWFGVDHWEIAPDVITFAKGITSGVVPFSGLVVSGHVADVLHDHPDGFPVGHTFSGYPLGCAVAAEAIRTIDEEGLLANAVEMGDRLRAGLDAIAGRHDCVGQVRGRGLLQGIELVESRERLEPRAGAMRRVVAAARAHGVLLYPCPTPLDRRHLECVLIAPPLIIDSADIDRILGVVDDALEAA